MSENNTRVLGRKEIEKVIPHRGQALMIDRVEYDPSQPDVAIGYKEILEDDPWIKGHFPKMPIFPGHCHIECANLVAAVLARQLFPHLSGLPMVKKIDEVCHKRPVGVYDKLRITVKYLSESRGKFFTFSAVIINDEGKIVTTIKEIVGVIA